MLVFTVVLNIDQGNFVTPVVYGRSLALHPGHRAGGDPRGERGRRDPGHVPRGAGGGNGGGRPASSIAAMTRRHVAATIAAAGTTRNMPRIPATSFPTGMATSTMAGWSARLLPYTTGVTKLPWSMLSTTVNTSIRTMSVVSPTPPETAIQCMVCAERSGETKPSVQAKGTRAINPTSRADTVDQVIAGYEALMQRLADSHAPEFLEIDITMPQAKLLYILGASGDLHMSDIVARLCVSLSTVSGLVDRVVDHGLATRREDRADRRQVVVGLTAAGREFIDRFRELNARQMRELLAVMDDAELALAREALAVLERAAVRVTRANPIPPSPVVPSPRVPTPRKDPA